MTILRLQRLLKCDLYLWKQTSPRQETLETHHFWVSEVMQTFPCAPWTDWSWTHLTPLPQHVQVLQAVSGQVAQGSLSQQQVLVGLTDQREGQTLDSQPQSAHLFREGVSSSQTYHSAVGLLQGQSLITWHHLHQLPVWSLSEQGDSTSHLPESQRLRFNIFLFTNPQYYILNSSILLNDNSSWCCIMKNLSIKSVLYFFRNQEGVLFSSTVKEKTKTQKYIIKMHWCRKLTDNCFVIWLVVEAVCQENFSFLRLLLLWLM